VVVAVLRPFRTTDKRTDGQTNIWTSLSREAPAFASDWEVVFDWGQVTGGT